MSHSNETDPPAAGARLARAGSSDGPNTSFGGKGDSAGADGRGEAVGLSSSARGLNPQAASFPCPVVGPSKTNAAARPAAVAGSGSSPPAAPATPIQATKAPESMPYLAMSHSIGESEVLGPNDGFARGDTEQQQQKAPPASSAPVFPGTPPRPAGQQVSMAQSPPPQAVQSSPLDTSRDSMSSPVMTGSMAHSLTLIDAIACDDVCGILQMLEQGISPDTGLTWCDPEGGTVPRTRSLLCCAAYYSARNVTSLLLSKGADPNLASRDDGTTPLHAAAAGGGQFTVDIIKMLLKAGANRDAIDFQGHRPVELLVQQPQPLSEQQPQPTFQQHVSSTNTSMDSDYAFSSFGTLFDGSECLVGPHVPDPHSCAENSDINKPEYSTDDFRINYFKVLQCSKTCAHDWTMCPFVHPGEKARRRSPLKYTYSSSACPDFRKGVCRRGDLCGFSHGVFECWLHPAKYRTQMCKDGGMCTRRVCFFAHSLSELRSPQPEPCVSMSAASASSSLEQAYASALEGALRETSGCSVAELSQAFLSNLKLAAMGSIAGGVSGLESSSTSQFGSASFRRHSEPGAPSSANIAWMNRRRSMQGEPFMAPSINRSSVDHLQSPPGLAVQPQAQQAQTQHSAANAFSSVLMQQHLQEQSTLQFEQRQQQLLLAQYFRPNASAATATSGMMSFQQQSFSCSTPPLASCRAPPCSPQSQGPLLMPPALRSPRQQQPPMGNMACPLSPALQRAPHQDSPAMSRAPQSASPSGLFYSPSQQTSKLPPSCQGSIGRPYLQHLVRTAEGLGLESQDMSRVNSLSSLDVSWVEDLTGLADEMVSSG